MSAAASADATVGRSGSAPSSGRRPIRVLSLTSLDAEEINAQQVNSQEVIRRLAGHDLHFTGFSERTVNPDFEGNESVGVVRLGHHLRSVRIFRELLRPWHVLWYPHPGLPEEVYFRFVHSRRTHGSRPAVVVPIEGDVAQFDEIPPKLRERAERIIRSADVVVPISAYVARTVQKRFGRTGPIIPVGVDTKVFHPGGRRPPSAPLRVVSVGTLKPWKRFDLVLEAARALPGVRFEIVGTGPLEGTLRATAPPNVSFRGRVSRAEMPSVYREADVLLHPSRMEGMPKVALEAMACGCVPVLFDAYEPQFLEDGHSGFVVASTAEMMRAILRVLDDVDARIRFSAAARERAERYGWDQVAVRWQRVFLGLA